MHVPPVLPARGTEALRRRLAAECLSAFTTFGAYRVETYALLWNGRVALVNVVGPVAVGLRLTAAGWRLAPALWP